MSSGAPGYLAFPDKGFGFANEGIGFGWPLARFWRSLSESISQSIESIDNDKELYVVRYSLPRKPALQKLRPRMFDPRTHS